MNKILLLAMLILSAAIPNKVLAESDKLLLIGTKVAPPFAMKNDDNRWHGISIDLWRELARRQGLSYEFVETDLKGLINHVKSGQLDASIAAITISRSREEQIDFSHAYFTTGLAIAVPSEKSSPWQNVITGVASLAFLKVIFFLSTMLAGFGSLIWLFERKNNPGQFGGSPLKGIGSGFWWAAVTMTTVGYGDKAPVTLWGRLIALIWMFAAIILISSVTAAITTSLTVSELSSTIQGPQDLNRVRVGTVEGSSSEAYLIAIDGDLKGYPTVQTALNKLLAGEVDAVLYDSPILKYEINIGFEHKISLLPDEFEQQAYGIALPPNSPMREPINRDLLTLTEEALWKEILYRYQGQ